MGLMITIGLAIFLYEAITGFITAWRLNAADDHEWRDLATSYDEQKEFYAWHMAMARDYGKPDEPPADKDATQWP